MKEGVLSLANEIFDPNEVFELACNIFIPQASSKQVHINWVAYDKLPRLIGDKRRLLQVLINLLKNSLKFTSEGFITVKAYFKTATSMLGVEVEDTGVGIAEEDLSKIFKKFGKLHRTADLNNQGIGLGLTIVKQIVECHQGKISVKSDGIGLGSVFAFTMRIESVPAECTEKQAPTFEI